MFKKTFFMMVFLFAAPFISNAEKIITVTTLTDYPPFTFDKKNAITDEEDIILPGSDSIRLQGYSWDILRESFHAMGYTLKLEIYPWSRAMKYTEMGKTDILFPAAWSKERATIFHYSGEPINKINCLIYVDKNSALKWHGLASLNGLEIGAMNAWNYGETWDDNQDIIKYPLNNILQGFRMLDKNRLQGIAGYEISFDYTLKEANWPNTYKKYPIFNSNLEYAVGPKKNPDIIEILNDFDTGKKKIIENGMFDKIEKKWLGN